MTKNAITHVYSSTNENILKKRRKTPSPIKPYDVSKNILILESIKESKLSHQYLNKYMNQNSKIGNKLSININ